MASEFESTSSGRKSGVTERIKEDGKQRIETTKRSAADQIEQVASVIGRAGSELGDGQPRLASYANQAADRVNALATRLREASIEELIEDTRDLARRNPWLFILGGVALGVVVSRFLKASASNVHSAEDWEYGTETYAGDLTGSAYPDQASAGTYSTGSTGSTGPGFSEQDTIDIEATRSAASTRQAQASKSNGGLP
ncbi:MAG TPA: hypothetical protein VFS24_15100 [Steroidobacteraceae bacterium]|nr:hypothetical protein [Steroidobacteraceae bacterium]